MKGGQAADLGPNQTRRHIVPALKAGGRHANEREMKMGRAVSTAQRSPYAKTGTSKGAPTKTLAGGSKATVVSTSAAGSEGTRQSEQSSGWAQAWPACSQSAVTSSQWQCSTASTPTVAHKRKARQAKSLERAAGTPLIFRTTCAKSSEAQSFGCAIAKSVRVGHSSWSYPDQPTRSLVAFKVTSNGHKLTGALGMSQIMKQNPGSPLLRTSRVKVAERMGFEPSLRFPQPTKRAGLRRPFRFLKGRFSRPRCGRPRGPGRRCCPPRAGG